MMFTCLVTVVVECAFAALLFGIRKKDDLLVVLAAQVLTNPVVEGFCGILLPMMLRSYGLEGFAYSAINVCAIAFFEIAAFIVEGIIYKHFDFKHPFAMSAVLNALSFGSGFLVFLW